MSFTKSQAALVLVVTSISTFLVLVAFIGAMLHVAMGCDGIDEYYTNSSFYGDVNDYKKIVHQRLDFKFAMDGDINTKLINIYAPKDMTNGTKFDCKAISNGIMCLAEKYDKVCRFTTEFKWAELFQSLIGHMGIECFDDNYKEWVELY